MPVIQLGQPVVFRPGTAFEERWGPGQYLSGMVTSVVGEDASLIVWPAGEYPPYYEIRVKRDDALSKPRTWTPSVSEDTEMPEAPTDGQIYGRRNQAWTPVSGAGGIGSGFIVISDTQPLQPLVGMAWLDTTINNFFVFFQDRWVEPAHINPTEEMVAVEMPFVSGTVAVDSTLSCTTGQWSGNPIGYTFQWYRDDTPIVGAVQSLYTTTLADVNHDLHCRVTARSKFELYVTAASNIIGVYAPINTEAPFVGGAVAIGAILVSSDGTWTGPGPIGFTYQWKRDGSIIAGATTNAYTILAGDTGKSITCLVTASNLVGPSSMVSNAVAIAVPSNIELPEISGTALVGQVLFSTNGLWANIPTGYTYQWMRSAVVIAGATAASYVLVAADSEDIITCVVTATNAIGSASATSNGIVLPLPVNLTPPVVHQQNKPSPPVPENDGLLGFAHESTTGTWTETALTFYTFQWKRNGVDIAGQTTSSYSLAGPADIGKTIACRVRNNDPNGFTDAMSNDIVVPVYAKFDPPTSLNVTFGASGAGAPDVRATHVGTANGGAKTLTLKSSGKWFIQYALHQFWYANGGPGFLLSTGTLADMIASQNCIKVNQQTGEIWTNGVYSGKRIGGLAGGHTISAAIDLDARLVWFRFDNGPWNSFTGQPSIETPGVNGGVSFNAGSFTPAICFVGSTFGATQDVTVNFGNSMSVSVPPAGFSRGWPA